MLVSGLISLVVILTTVNKPTIWAIHDEISNPLSLAAVRRGFPLALMTMIWVVSCSRNSGFSETHDACILSTSKEVSFVEDNDSVATLNTWVNFVKWILTLVHDLSRTIRTFQLFEMASGWIFSSNRNHLIYSYHHFLKTTDEIVKGFFFQASQTPYRTLEPSCCSSSSGLPITRLYSWWVSWLWWSSCQGTWR